MKWRATAWRGRLRDGTACRQRRLQPDGDEMGENFADEVAKASTGARGRLSGAGKDAMGAAKEVAG